MQRLTCYRLFPVEETHWSQKKMDNSTNSIQFANLIASRSTLKLDNIFRSKPISFLLSSFTHFILFQPLSHVPPITSSSYFVFRFRALPFLYTILFHLLFHVILCSLHTTAPPILFSSYNASFTSFFTLYIFQASIFLKSRFATFPHFSSKHPPSFFFFHQTDNPTLGRRVSTYPPYNSFFHAAISRWILYGHFSPVRYSAAIKMERLSRNGAPVTAHGSWKLRRSTCHRSHRER